MSGRGRRSGPGCWVLPAFLALTAGCAGLPASAKQELIKAYGQHRDGDFAAACWTLDQFLSEHSRHPESAEAYYLRALCHAEQSHRARAEADALSCIKLSKQSTLRAKAHAMAGAVLFESGKTSEAIRHYAAGLPGLARKPPTDLARYRYGLCLQREGRWKEARLEFAAVFQRYPDSDLAVHAKRMFDWPHDHFSIQCGAFRDEAGATKLMKELKEAGVRARVETRPRRGALFHTVYAGRYPMVAQARAALPLVQRRVADALIVP